MENQNAFNSENSSISFSQLSLKEQKQKLSDSLDFIMQSRKNEIVSSNIEFQDISYNIDSDGKVIYDVTLIINDDNGKHEEHEFYNDSLEKIELNQELINMQKAIGADTTDMQKQLDNLNSLQENPEKISLSSISEKEKAFSEEAKSLGLPEEDLISSSTITKNDKIATDFSKIAGIQSNDINADERVGIYDKMKDVIGGNYVSYKIVKTKNGTPMMFGINPDGSAEEITSDQMRCVTNLPSNKLMLMQNDGKTKNVGIVAMFQVNDPGSDKNRNQYVGISIDNNSQMTSFYARTDSNNDNELLAEEIPTSNINPSIRKNQLEKMGIVNNPEINPEATSAYAKTNDGCTIDSSNISGGPESKDLEELAETYAIVYRIDKHKLLNSIKKEMENNHTQDLDDEDVVKKAAEEMQDEKYQKDSNDSSNDSSRENCSSRNLGDHGIGAPEEPSREERNFSSNNI